MKTIDHLKDLKNLLTESARKESKKLKEKRPLQLSLQDVHAKGLFSLVMHGTTPGELIRAFVSSVELKPYEVQLHTHRYPIRLTVLKGQVKHHLATIEPFMSEETLSLSLFKYKSFLNGGSGLKYKDEVNVKINEHVLPVGSIVNLGTKDFHTMSCSPGSIWIVEELGFEKKSSKVIGVPFITEELYNKPEMFQINDNCQLVLKQLNKLIRDYEEV